MVAEVASLVPLEAGFWNACGCSGSHVLAKSPRTGLLREALQNIWHAPPPATHANCVAQCCTNMPFHNQQQHSGPSGAKIFAGKKQPSVSR